MVLVHVGCISGILVLITLVSCINVKIGILLPEADIPLSQEACFSIHRIRPVVALALDNLYGGAAYSASASVLRTPLPPPPHTGLSITAEFVDSQCSDTHGPVAAMDMFYRGEIHAFFGPCCKYALSPVARYSKVWGLPVLTPGGLTPAFSNKAEFPLLTRIVAPYDKLVPFLLDILHRNSWYHTSLLWHNNLFEPTLGASEWQQVIEAVIRTMRAHSDVFPEPYKDYFDQSRFDAFEWRQIFDGIRNNSRGMYIYTLCSIYI